MYEERRYTFDWKGFILKLLIVLIVLFLLYKFIPAVKVNTLYDQVFNDNLVTMKDAAKSYYTKDRLPEKIGDSKTMTLQDMLNEKMLVNFVDKNGKYCDTFGSYTTITKTKDDEYLLKVQLSCGDQIDYVLETIGCYNVCTDNKCQVQEEVEDKFVKVTQYQFKKAVTTKKTTKSCKTGYTLSGNTCYKTIKSEYVDAKKVYYDDVTSVTDSLKSEGATNKVYTNERVTTQANAYTNERITSNSTVYASKITIPGTTTTEKVSSTESGKATCTTSTSYTAWKYAGQVNSCSSSSTVKCEYEGTESVKTCDTCITVRRPVYNKYTRSQTTSQDCKCDSSWDNQVGNTCYRTVYKNVTSTSPSSTVCPTGYDEAGSRCSKVVSTSVCPTGYTPEGSKCYKTVTTTSCPTGYTPESNNSVLSCYKNVTADGEEYCKDENATLKDGKCTVVTKGTFKEYKCEDSKMNLIGSKCYAKISDSMKATTTTKNVTSYKYTWSDKTTLVGWTKTNKTRVVSVKDTSSSNTTTDDTKKEEEKNTAKDEIIEDSNKELTERLNNVNSNKTNVGIGTIILYILVAIGFIYLFVMFLTSRRNHYEN